MNKLTSNILSVLAARVRDAHDRARTASVEAAERYLEAGRLLLEAKADCPHGEWLPFLEAAGVHDLRRVSREVAQQMGGISHGTFISGSWQAAFSRAVAALARRNLIEVLQLVPVKYCDVDYHRPVHHLADGTYLDWDSRQRRFVRVMKRDITLRKAA